VVNANQTVKLRMELEVEESVSFVNRIPNAEMLVETFFRLYSNAECIF
jgi:hypothetical protein